MMLAGAYASPPHWPFHLGQAHRVRSGLAAGGSWIRTIGSLWPEHRFGAGCRALGTARRRAPRPAPLSLSAECLNNYREIEINLPIYLLVRSLGPYGVENVLVDRSEMVGKTHDLKPVAITDGPNLQIAPAPVNVHVTGSLIHG